MERMTEEQFRDQEDEILKDVPIEFHGPLRGMAWDQGHSAGFEEVIGDLREMVYRLKPAIAEYTARIVG
jgi:hypothetical protein